VLILIVEHNPERQRAVAAALAAAGHRTESVSTGGAGLTALARPTPPDLVVLQERMPDFPALDFLQAAARMPFSPPVLVIGDDQRAASWVEASRYGAVDFVTADGGGHYLGTLAARAQATRRRSQARDREARLADALSSTAAAVLIADRTGRLEYLNDACVRLLGRTTAADLEGTLGDLFPLEETPRVKAELLAAVHVGAEWAGEVEVRRASGESVPCIVTVSPVRRPGGRVEGVVLTLRDVSDRVAMEEALRAANRRLADQASRDAHTGQYNRAYFREILARELARAERYDDELCVLMADQDDFKRVNDEHGHTVGDEVLVAVAQTLRSGLRDGDVLARYGGDEFCVLLPSTGRDAGWVVAERVRQLVEARGFGPGDTLRLTVSIGLATSADLPREDGSRTDLLLTLADEALLEAKRRGGNTVACTLRREAP
jgi:diguanylate cyclase (GGDEF)-like protein/PAS domain S-box-containing protein